jgi:LysM repeat protein
MKKLFNVIVFMFLSILIFSGCRTTRRSTASTKSLNNIIRNHDERISELNFQLKQINESNNQAVRKLNELTRQNTTLKQQVAALGNNVATLGKAIEAEQNNRHTETERLLKEVAKQTTAAINTRTAALQRQQPASRNTGRPPTKGSFYEYKVQPGATLGAIAKAYKVSVADIKKANKLKSDIIRVGQKLYIPKK